TVKTAIADANLDGTYMIGSPIQRNFDPKAFTPGNRGGECLEVAEHTQCFFKFRCQLMCNFNAEPQMNSVKKIFAIDTAQVDQPGSAVNDNIACRYQIIRNIQR